MSGQLKGCELTKSPANSKFLVDLCQKWMSSDANGSTSEYTGGSIWNVGGSGLKMATVLQSALIKTVN